MTNFCSSLFSRCSSLFSLYCQVTVCLPICQTQDCWPQNLWLGPRETQQRALCKFPVRDECLDKREDVARVLPERGRQPFISLIEEVCRHTLQRSCQIETRTGWKGNPRQDYRYYSHQDTFSANKREGVWGNLWIIKCSPPVSFIPCPVQEKQIRFTNSGIVTETCGTSIRTIEVLFESKPQ